MKVHRRMSMLSFIHGTLKLMVLTKVPTTKQNKIVDCTKILEPFMTCVS